jgi:hypothetical protein
MKFIKWLFQGIGFILFIIAGIACIANFFGMISIYYLISDWHKLCLFQIILYILWAIASISMDLWILIIQPYREDKENGLI